MPLRILGQTPEELGRLWLLWLHKGESLGVKLDTTYGGEIYEDLEDVFQVPLVYAPVSSEEVAIYCCEETQRIFVVGQIVGLGLWAVELTDVLSQEAQEFVSDFNSALKQAMTRFSEGA